MHEKRNDAHNADEIVTQLNLIQGSTQNLQDYCHLNRQSIPPEVAQALKQSFSRLEAALSKMKQELGRS